MKFNPITKEVYTDKDQFVKKLNCPFKMKWDDLEQTNSTFRKCSNCESLIINTKYYTDNELLEIIKQKPNTCFKVDLNQHNVKLISNGILEQK